MKLTRLLPVLAIIFTFISCQKEYELTEGNPISRSSKVKIYTEEVSYDNFNRKDSFELVYDSEDRVITMTSKNDPGNYFAFSYLPGKVNMQLFNSNIISIHQEFYINSQSQIDSTLQYNESKDTATEKYYYNNRQQLTMVREYDYSSARGARLTNTATMNYDADGNVARRTEGNTSTTYEYYPGLKNNIVLMTIGLPTSQGLVKTQSINTGGTIETVSYVYTFDNMNRVTSETASTDNGATVTKTYTYY